MADKENADATQVKAEKEEVKAPEKTNDVAKALTDAKALLKGLDVSANKDEFKGFLDELAGLVGLKMFAKDEKEVKTEEKEIKEEDKAEFDARENFISNAEKLVNATKNLDSLSNDLKDLMKTNTETLQKGLEDLVSKAVSSKSEEITKTLNAVKQELTDNLSKIEKRLEKVEAVEGVSATKDISSEKSDDDDESTGGVFKGIFDLSRARALAHFAD